MLLFLMEYYGDKVLFAENACCIFLHVQIAFPIFLSSKDIHKNIIIVVNLIARVVTRSQWVPSTSKGKYYGTQNPTTATEIAASA